MENGEWNRGGEHSWAGLTGSMEIGSQADRRTGLLQRAHPCCGVWFRLPRIRRPRCVLTRKGSREGRAPCAQPPTNGRQASHPNPCPKPVSDGLSLNCPTSCLLRLNHNRTTAHTPHSIRCTPCNETYVPFPPIHPASHLSRQSRPAVFWGPTKPVYSPQQHSVLSSVPVLADTQTHRHTDTQTDRQTDRQTD